MVEFLHTFHPSPVLVKLGTVTIGWYGLLLAVGTGAALLVMAVVARRGSLKLDVTGLFLNTFVVGLIGARLYHVLNEIGYYGQHPAEIIAIWQGGLAIHGGLIAGFLYLLWYSRRHKQSLWQLTDLIAPALILGQAIGRWGNYFNQELYGKPTNLPWGIPIDQANRLKGLETASYFHPTSLYESVWNLIVFGVLFLLYRDQVNEKTTSTQPGVVTAAYLLLYALGRAGTELLRIDSTPTIGGLRLPLLFSLLVVMAASYGLYRLVHRIRSLT